MPILWTQRARRQFLAIIDAALEETPSAAERVYDAITHSVSRQGCAMTGAIDEGLQALEVALHEVDLREERLYEAELYRLQGVLLLRQPGTPHGEAEACFQRALDIAHRQEAKSLELRAAMSLACLWQHQDRRVEARALLAPVYGWFTEGFDTADLQGAKALLDALGG
jgi:predicted ATPase